MASYGVAPKVQMLAELVQKARNLEQHNTRLRQLEYVKTFIFFFAAVAIAVTAGFVIALVWDVNSKISRFENSINAISDVLAEYNMDEVIRRAMPPDTESMSELSSTIVNGFKDFAHLTTYVRDIGVIDVLYPIMDTVVSIVEDSRTQPVADALVNVTLWGARHVEQGAVDRAGALVGTTLEVGSTLLTSTAFVSLQNLINDPAVRPMVEDAGALMRSAANFTRSPDTRLALDRAFRGWKYATEGPNLPWMIDSARLFGASAAEIAQKITEHDIVGRLPGVADTLRDFTSIAQHFFAQLNAGLSVKMNSAA